MEDKKREIEIRRLDQDSSVFQKILFISRSLTIVEEERTIQQFQKEERKRKSNNPFTKTCN